MQYTLIEVLVAVLADHVHGRDYRGISAEFADGARLSIVRAEQGFVVKES